MAIFWNIHFTCAVAFLVRIGLMVYGEWQDRTMAVKYTDIDYHVFTDAARHVFYGRSPYERATYRYTPLLAMLLTPNISLNIAFGKVLFILFDILSGFLIFAIQKERGLSYKTCVVSSWFWFFNPMPATVSSRGNAESIMAALVLITLYFALKRKEVLTGFFLALAVHFKIFPIIYSLPLFLLIGERSRDAGLSKSWSNGGLELCKALLGYIFRPARVILVLVCVTTLVGLTLGLYVSYGFEFLEHTYLYHVTRTDLKHNFSVYFYMLYLTQDMPWSRVIGLLAFVPQLVMTVVLAFKYYRDICFCCLLQTFAFVTFNKVCTSQYFLWYLCLLPLAVPYIRVSLSRALVMAFSWFAAQGLWLLAAYYLEFQGFNTFIFIWLASIVFFVVNLWILVEFIKSYQPLTKSDSKKSN
ncbi:predicted protein [Nematostella vectensis]|uniref:GPI alpha-1,4-mannosyltransferase I, catalytic subunit n=1 Tax=Nematostella vectensis TaxID=45351 RepID=A7STD8_NEMVE|nr:predicted protein [Nematostella vectensis]|eukprot:XP_001625130.1 predicted protein [Nematostella vectensis]